MYGWFIFTLFCISVIWFHHWSKWVNRENCAYGHHWYGGKVGVYTCGTYNRTGPLEGEHTASNGQGQGGYRRERHCLCCNRQEYYHGKLGRWVDITHIARKTDTHFEVV